MSDSRTNTYDPKKVIVIFGGHEVSGYSEDSIVSIEPNGGGITKVVGADGEITRNMDPDETFKVKIALQQSSNSNTFLHKIHKLDRTTGKGIKPLYIKDLSGALVFSTDEAWITNYPKTDKKKKSGDNEWSIETGVAQYEVGGM